MFLMFAGAGLLLLLVAVVISFKNDDSMTARVMAGTGVTLVIFFGAISFFIWGEIGPQVQIIQKKIAMYEEENSKIEADVATMVQNYMSHERTTYEGLVIDSQNPITVATMYPELTSNSLVETQISCYTTNRQKIIALQEEQIGLKGKAWLVFFGDVSQ